MKVTKQTLFALSLGFGGVIWATQNANAAPMQYVQTAAIERMQANVGGSRHSIGLGQDTTKRGGHHINPS